MQDPERDAEIARWLAVWFSRSARDLPWRRTRDPYRIWLSEVMLQQTRVDTVIPYFERFLARFPTAAALAEAPLDDVLSLWSGLGYYSRARSLHKAAQQVVTEHDGSFPRTAEELRGLAGVGPYTAGAIASIAFDERAPLVDGNVARVLSRVNGISLDARGTEAQKVFWETAERLVKADPDVPPSVLNQSLMELGALVCTPIKPGCGVCPLSKVCVAHRDGTTSVLPVMGPRAKPKPVAMVAVVVWQEGRVLMARRAPEGLFGGMWEPPLVECEEVESAAPRFGDFGIEPSSVRLASKVPVRHVLSHRSLTVAVARGALTKTGTLPEEVPSPYDRVALVVPSSAPGGVSTLASKILAAAPDPGAPLVLSAQTTKKKAGRKRA